MAAPSLILFHTNNLSSPFPLYSPKRYKNKTLNDNSFLNFKKQSLLPNLRVKNPRAKNPRSAPGVVFAVQSNFLKGLCTETDSKGCGDSCCLGSFVVFAKIIPVYSFLCAGYDGTGILHIHCLEQRPRTERRWWYNFRGPFRRSKKNNGKVQVRMAGVSDPTIKFLCMKQVILELGMGLK